jgi:hypothetical protein
MAHDKITSCPQCSRPLERGFTSRAAGLHFVAPEELARFVVLGRDLHDRNLRVRLLPSKAYFSMSFHCTSCRLFLVDYETKLSRQEVNAIAASLTSPRRAFDADSERREKS